MKFLFVLLCALGAHAWVKEMENAGLYEGDMILDPEQVTEAKKGTFAYSSLRDKRKMWPNSVVPYVIEPTLKYERKAVRAIEAALRDYHYYTCIVFKKRTYERGYISLYKGNGCSSRVGYGGDRMRVSLSSGCWTKSTAMHEIGHALGLHHEQTRPDRDRYVEIVRSNIHYDTYFNFQKETTSNIDFRQTSYDYLSMMHYSWNAFAINTKKPSIRTLDPKYQYHIGQDTGFSRTDVVQLNRMYTCSKTFVPPEYKIIPGCYDVGGGCANLVEDGSCIKPSWKTYVTKSCRRSCKLCGDGGGGVTQPPPVTYTRPVVTDSVNCYNRVIDCDSLGRHRCTDRDQKWRDYMKRSCKRYCKLC